jgi:hypothetical protein
VGEKLFMATSVGIVTFGVTFLFFASATLGEIFVNKEGFLSSIGMSGAVGLLGGIFGLTLERSLSDKVECFLKYCENFEDYREKTPDSLLKIFDEIYTDYKKMAHLNREDFNGAFSRMFRAKYQKIYDIVNDYYQRKDEMDKMIPPTQPSHKAAAGKPD